MEAKRDINVLALTKEEERYIFLYDDDHRGEALRTLGRFASNPDLSFSWYEAAVLSQKIRKLAHESMLQDIVHKSIAASPQEQKNLVSNFFTQLSYALPSSGFSIVENAVPETL